MLEINLTNRTALLPALRPGSVQQELCGGCWLNSVTDFADLVEVRLAFSA